MSSEVIPVSVRNATSSTSKKEVQHSCSVQPLDMLNPRTIFSPKVTVDLTGGDYHTKQFLASKRGHKYVKQFNPTLISVKPLLDKVKEASVLLLRGCDMLLQSPGFTFDKFKSITALEISSCPRLTALPENTISHMTCLQSLDLSYLPIDRLPDDIFVNTVHGLRSLVLRGCSNLRVLPEPPEALRELQYLDLSLLPIQTLPDGFISWELRSLILRGCSKLRSLRLAELSLLHFLDVCHCTSLENLTTAITSDPMVVDLSYTALAWHHVPHLVSHLFFRNSKICFSMNTNVSSFNIKVCDLSGSRYLFDIHILDECCCLEALDLSGTRIESIRFLSWLTSLHTLVLRNCTELKQLPTIEQLENLEVLDLSGCEILDDLPQGLSKQRKLKELNLCGCKSLRYLEEGLFDQMSGLEKLDISNTEIEYLPSFDNLINIGTVIKHSHASVMESNTASSYLVNLDSDNVGCLGEFHIVSTFISNSEFDKFIYKFTELNHYVTFLEEKFTRSIANTEAARVKRQFESMRADLDYILDKIDLLESSQNCRSCEELVHELMSYDYSNLDHHSSIFKKMLRTVVKLKILVPPPRPLIVEERTSKLKPTSLQKTINIVENYFPNPENILVRAYESLTPIQRNCLLYFACLPISGNKSIKDNTLMHLWYGEGFFDPLLYANPNTIEEIGREVLQALQENGLITTMGGSMWDMSKEVHEFVITKAMEEHSFDFNERRKLTPQFGISRRACLVKADIDHPPSTHVWLKYTKSSEQLESFKTVRTLLFIDEPVVDINKKWFSSMANLHVLNLVNLCSEPVNIVDLKFLEELKSMKQLRLLNLESYSAISKLPDSICELTDLRILNLKHCSNLMELPAGIASLTNLVILDLTQCHLLPRLPKGLALLSKLEVLKGFPVTYKASGRQSKKACTLRELLKLKRLRKLNVVVNKDSFPDARDVQVLRNMNELRNLKITWCQNISKAPELVDTLQKRAVRQSRWKLLKCWVLHNQTEEVEDESLLTNNCLGNLNKLVLCCFPSETAPNWLNPTELQKLERLYMVGGSLKALFEDYTGQTTWRSVKALKLKYLSNLKMDWSILQDSFPCVESRVQHGCPNIQNFTKDTKYDLGPEDSFS